MDKVVETRLSFLIAMMADSDPRLSGLLAYSVGRVCLNASRCGEDWEALLDVIDTSHIVDWLKAAVINDDPWLKNIDSKGRPKKLMKFSNLQDIVREADKAMYKSLQRIGTIDLIDGDEEVFMELENGHRLVRLLTTAALDREGKLMQHCIGGGSYDEDVRSGYTVILSLRDKSNKPHVTLEIENGTIVQLQGKQNKAPKLSYVAKLKPFFMQANPSFDIPLKRMGYVVGSNGEAYDFEKMPNGLKIKGTLDFREVQNFELPQDLTLDGDLVLTSTDVAKLPSGLKVGGTLDISATHVSQLPPDLSVGGRLLLRNTKIEVLPDNFQLDGSIVLQGSRIRSLPKGLSIGGSLDLFQTGIKQLPENLYVGENLYLTKSLITSIPAGTRIGNDLFSMNCNDLLLPEDMYIPGGLYLRYSDTTSLPDNLHVGGDLDIRSTKVSQLPSGLRVDGNLIIDGAIHTLPSDILLGGRLSIAGPLSESLLQTIRDDDEILTDTGFTDGRSYKERIAFMNEVRGIPRSRP